MKIGERAEGLVRVNSTMAKRFYEEGKDVYLLPSNVRVGSMVQPPILVSRGEFVTFDGFVNAFGYYNLDKERGLHINYLVKEEDR